MIRLIMDNKKRRKTFAHMKKIICFILCANLIAGMIPAQTVNADILIDEGFIISENDICTEEEILSEDKEREPDILTEEVTEEPEGAVKEGVSENEITKEVMELTAEDIKEKEKLRTEIEAVSDGTPGVDYKEDRVILLCDDEDEALETAKAYSEATGIDVSLDSFEYGVATLALSEGEGNDDIAMEGRDTILEEERPDAEEDTVEDIVKLASDPEVMLPAVYSDQCLELCSINPVNEEFNDPYLKNYSGAGTGADVKGYQWFHDTIDSKYVFNAEESGEMADPSDVTVAIIDSGMNSLHEDFEGVDIVGGVNITVSENSAESTDYTDDNGHGTNVAGIISNTADNGKGGRGIATAAVNGKSASAKILPVKVTDSEGKILLSYVLKALNYIKEKNEEGLNIRVINLSLASKNELKAIEPLLSELYNDGIMIIAAASNNNTDQKYYPAAYEEVLAVGAVASDYNKAESSCYGSWVDISAPGGDKAKGEYIYAASNTSNTGYKGYAGTSQASPVVAAIAALIIANEPELTPAEVEKRLTETATITDTDYDMGAGIVNAAAALNIANVPEKPEIEISYEGEGIVKVDMEASNPEGVIYYTLDETYPDSDSVNENDVNISSEGTHIYSDVIKLDCSESFKSEGTVELCIKAVTLLYGRKSGLSCETFEYVLDVKVESIELSASGNISKIGVGKTLALKTTVLPKTATNREVVYKSSDTSVLRVSDDGTVTALGPSPRAEGEAGDVLEAVSITATATDGSGVYGTYEITVMPAVTNLAIKAPVIGVDEIADNAAILLKMNGNEGDDTYSLSSDKIVISPSGASNEVVYSSSDESVLKVSEEGIVKAVSSGDAVVTVMAADGSGISDSVGFRVSVPVTKIEIEDTLGRDILTATKKLTPTVIFNDGLTDPDNKELIWEIIEGADYARIDSLTGVLTGKANSVVNAGSIIRVKAASAENSDIYGLYECRIYPRVTKLSFTQKTVSAVLGEVIPGEGENGYISFDTEYVKPAGVSTDLDDYDFTSSDENVATVDDEGNITAHSAGSAKIKMIAKDGSNKKAVLNVEVGPDYEKYSEVTKVNISTDSGLGINDGKLILDEVGSYVKIIPSVIPTDAYDKEFIYVSGNSKVATIDENGILTAVSNGRTVIRVKAVDGSGKYARLIVTVAQAPNKVKIAPVTEGVNTICPAKSVKFRATVTGPAGTEVADTSVTFSITGTDGDNNRIADDELDKYAVISDAGVLSIPETAPLNSDGIKVLVKAVSNADATVYGTYTIRVLETPQSLSLVAPLGDHYIDDQDEGEIYYKVDAGDSLILRGLFNYTAKDYIANNMANNSGSFSYIKKINALVEDPSVVYSITDENGNALTSEYATVNSKSGKFAASKPQVIGYEERTVYVKAASVSYPDIVSEPIKILINPSMHYATDISVVSKTGNYDLGYGSRLQLMANLNEEADDESVVWSAVIIDGDSEIVSEDEVAEYINYNLLKKKGIVRAKLKRDTHYKVRVTATVNAGVEGKELSDTADITVYDRIVKIVAAPLDEDVTNIIAPGEEIIIGAESFGKTRCSDETLKDETCNDYAVTYSTGKAKVILETDNGDRVRVYGYKKGTVRIIFTARDGSGKKTVYKVYIK
ncbi:MAG: S8 family serine peptidase [Lachnospiraceae bacterium]|nr:S8 family serine peptidase [Lachnospiraceae bacterium]